MSLLGKMLNKQAKEINEIKEVIEETKQLRFTRNWLDKQAINHNLVPSDDKEKVDKILLALERKNGQCPCGGNGLQYKCPCEKIRIHGICTCGLFKSVPPRKMSGTTEVADIKRS